MKEKSFRYIEADGRLAYLLNRSDETFPLKDLFLDESPPYASGDQFIQTYFRTESENIYFLDKQGILINRRKSLENNKLLFLHLDPRNLINDVLTIGQPFDYHVGETSALIEIISIARQIRSADFLRNITQSRRTSIVAELIHGLPVQRIS